MGRRNSHPLSEFSKRALQSKRTRREGNSAVVKDFELPTPAPKGGEATATTTPIKIHISANAISFGSIISTWAAGASRPLPVRKSTEPIIAYRGWRLVNDSRGPALHSVTADVVWDGPILRANGKPSNEYGSGGWYVVANSMNYLVTSSDYVHGIYAYRTPERVMEEASYAVWGEIEAFGKVVVHESGIRCEAARIRRLLIPSFVPKMPRDSMFISFGNSPPNIPVSDSVLAQLAARYGCEVNWYKPPFA